MARYKYLLYFFLFQWMGMLWLPIVIAGNKTELKFMTQEFAPFNYSQNDEVRGPVAEIIKIVCNQIGVNCTFKSGIWAGAQEMVKKGHAHALFVIGWNEAHEKWLHFSPPILKTEYGFFVRKDNPLNFQQIKDIKGYTVGVYGPSNTSTSLQKIKAAVKDLNLDMSKKDEGAFRKLSVNRVDAVYSNRDVGFDLIKKLGLKNIRYAGKHKELFYYIGFSKKFTPIELVEKFNAVLRDQYFSPEVQNIISEHHMTAVEPAYFTSQKKKALASVKPLRIMALDFPPYEFKANNTIDGITVRIVNEVFKQMNQPIVIEMLPWPRALMYLKTGQGDGAFEILKKPEREKYANYSHEVLMEETVSLFVVDESKIEFDGQLKNLSQYNFGVRQAFSYGSVFDSAKENGILPNLTQLSDAKRLVLLLCYNRIDILTGDKYGIPFLFNTVIKDQTTNPLPKKIKRMVPDVQSTPAYMAFSRKDELDDVRKHFDITLAEIKKDGTYVKIINEWETGQ